ncbi:MAG: hypothetical protein ACXWUE_42470 [Polyangiales bacterium]
MAIDFFVMPFSRYVAGDFITPAMQLAWETAGRYVIVGPDGTRELANGEPFGGADAAQRREAILPTILDDLRALPVPLDWDERSAAEPRFHRVDPTSYRALLEEANQRRGRPSFLGFLTRAQVTTPHLTAAVFLPCAFDETFQMASPFERVVGSIDVALRELAAGNWSDRTSPARETLHAALEDAQTLRLPMFVDW